jgi:virginiamycin B lyase
VTKRTFSSTQRCSLCIVFALLALLSILAGCSNNIGHANAHTFTGRLTLSHLPEPYSTPQKMIAGPDGKIWFPSVAFANFGSQRPSGAIGSIASDGTFHLFPLPSPNSYPLQITIGHNGVIWFTLFQGNGQLAPNVDTAPRFSGGSSAIGTMTTDGQFHFFTLPSSGVSLDGIAAGPDGNLWFTETAFDQSTNRVPKIGRITPAGKVTEFALSSLPETDSLGPIIAAPDGNLWFGVDSYNPSNYYSIGKMGRISPQGAFKIFSLGNFDEPKDLTIGPDNNVWFTTNFSLGRLTLDGQLRMFDPDPHANSNNRISIGGLVTGSDGALWFATANVTVGRVTTDGTFKFYSFPKNTFFDNGSSSLTLGQLKGIASAADGTLWLNDGAQMGHFV